MDDYSLFQAIMNSKPPEKLLTIPEWKTDILCKALPAMPKVRIQLKALDREANIYDYSEHFFEIVCHGCFNPDTGNPAFKLEQEKLIMESGKIDGSPIVPLAMTVLRLSNLIEEGEKAKGEETKNA